MASESEAAKQTLQMTLEETEMCHAHELSCMAARNEGGRGKVEGRGGGGAEGKGGVEDPRG